MGRFREIQGDAGEIWGRLLAQCLGQGRGGVGERCADLVEGAWLGLGLGCEVGSRVKGSGWGLG